ncbi:MAG: efflux RND transporter periplasmic adaptor subunit [Betaproteobacteria bacterium]|nr:efflux RND transporter periplasmic adaptor subunit [Betaproteobacteria bacterium]
MCPPAASPSPFLALSAAALVAACGPQGGPPPGGFPPAVVAVQEVKPAARPIEFEFPAQTAGSREVEVRARVTGILHKRNYEEGARVAAGQSLFTIDPVPFEAALARSEADAVAAEAQFNQASRNAKRYKPLWETKAVSQKEYDDAVSAEEIAAAQLKAAKARLTEAKLNVTYTRVESPIPGVTSRALKSEGSLVSGPDVLLTTVTQTDPMYVNFGLSESEQTRLARDAAAGKLQLPKDGKFEVVLRFEDGTTYAKPGRLAFSDVRVSGSTGTSDARAEMPNADGRLRPGQFVRAILKGAVRPDAIAVPQRAVMEGPQGKMVYVLGAESKAEPRPVTVGEWSGTDWIILEGLKPGDKVIVDGLMKVFPGGAVQVGDPNQPPPGAPGAPKKADAKPEAKGDAKPQEKK